MSDVHQLTGTSYAIHSGDKEGTALQVSREAHVTWCMQLVCSTMLSHTAGPSLCVS